jgi:lipopolysaccharide/colanic/teichoic acid biosynthesis glycosyltransferase
MRLPTSRGSFRVRISTFDAAAALIAPWLALWLRDAQILSVVTWQIAALYGFMSFAFSLLAFLIFRTRDGMSSLFSVNDALDAGKAVILSQFMTILALFTFTRLDGVPRSTPIIQALILLAAMIAARTIMRLLTADLERPARRPAAVSENIIMIGSTRLSALYIKFLEAYAPAQHRVIAMLDDQPEMNGRAVSGVRIVGPPQHLDPVIEEYLEHGIRTDRVIVGGETDMLAPDVVKEIERICLARNIRFDFVPALIGLGNRPGEPLESAAETEPWPAPHVALPGYFKVKHLIDFCITLLLLLLLLPLIAVITCMVLIDVGSPVLFWQQRIGVNGRTFLVHKFRTLKPSFDRSGMAVRGADRMSWVGRLLRATRLDELPQLLNVLVGDMSLVGPRPLLPDDQPVNPSRRLMVRPGITGWAQVNGGKLLSAQEKNELDEWYIDNASFVLDMRIILMTLQVIILGERRLDRAARLERQGMSRPHAGRTVRHAAAGGSPRTTASG